MTKESLTDALIRLQKLQLDPKIQAYVDEAGDLLAEGRVGEAEALIENVAARMRVAESTTVAVPATDSTSREAAS